MMTIKAHALLILTQILFITPTSAFGVAKLSSVRPHKPLYLEDHVAEMIDNELYRLRHREEFEQKWQQKNSAVLEPSLPQNFEFASASDFQDSKIPIRDIRLAARDPQKYCADRCVKSGYCEVFEEFFEMKPEDVLNFCKECVLSEDEEPCDVPESFYADHFLRP
uniref:Uncharacterized protein n=1 Tax=Ditylum brightwellii TaxID=49249 RepID=A0A6S8ZPR3_9STRA|mmetsp:Transcript_25015/g.37064  ORF Transcript_25015/g.37064 Transcript_25015/m.37064 type:complete len:165 (+) Transcript_25015:32-526(+)